MNSQTDLSANICVLYFSINDYNPLLANCTEEGDINKLCASGFCVTIGEIDQCHPAPMSNRTIDETCSSNLECMSRKTGDYNQVFFSECGCGLNPNGE